MINYSNRQVSPTCTCAKYAPDRNTILTAGELIEILSKVRPDTQIVVDHDCIASVELRIRESNRGDSVSILLQSSADLNEIYPEG